MSMVLIEHYVHTCVPDQDFVSETLYNLQSILCYMCEMLNHCYLAELCCGAKVAVSGLP